MKKNIHPAYHKLKLRIGTETIEVMSTCDKGEMLVDVVFWQQPAWTKKGVAAASNTNQNISAFNKRFSGIAFGGKS